MSRNATSSWSGYAHQGKIGLLIALKKINALHGSVHNLSQFILEYETQEDAKISNLGVVLEVHQVKALQSSETIGSYTEALSVFEVCPGSNYLHSICEIRNWANLTAAQNPGGVIRYPYSAVLNHCPLADIFTYIDTEIQILLLNHTHPQSDNTGWRENVFQEFLATLDEKIRYEHQHHNAATYNISFDLGEIVAIMTAPAAKSRSKLFAIRNALYQEYIKFIDDLEINTFTPTPEHEKRIEIALEAIYKLPDDQLIQFLKNINPHTTQGKVLQQCETTDAFFSSDAFYGTFLATLIGVTEIDYTLDANVIPNYFKDSSYILTAIQSSEMQKRQHAKSILTNESINFSAYETDYIITQNYSGELGECASKINIIGRDATKFCNPKKMQFIPHTEAIDKLNT